MIQTATAAAQNGRRSPKDGLWSRFTRALYKYRYLYLMALPAVIWYILFRYLPMLGMQIAFKDYNFSKGIYGSPWVGLKHFIFLFTKSFDFLDVLRNTIIINIMNLVFFFPVGIILALMINELKSQRLKKGIQTAVYFPHFLSWVIFGGVVIQLLSPNDGMVNMIIKMFGGEPIYFMSRSEYFRWIIVATNILKESGWGAIIYLAALSGIDVEQYEAAIVDGAGRWKRLIHITLPGIMNTIVIMLILRVGYLLEVGFEQIYVMYNPAVYDVGDVISTYIYRIGVLNTQFSLTTALGLFQSVIGFVLIVFTNHIAKKNSDVSLY